MVIEPVSAQAFMLIELDIALAEHAAATEAQVQLQQRLLWLLISP